MLLELSTYHHGKMTESWRDQFKAWMDSLGLDVNRIAWVECCPEANILWTYEYRMHPETNSPYLGKGQNIVADEFVVFYDRHPPRLFFHEWERVVIANQGHQGA